MKRFKKAAAFTLACASGIFGLTGCGGTTSTSKEAGTNKQSANVDTFIFAQSAEPNKLDPAFATDGFSSNVIGNVFESLMGFKPESLEIEPCLAESFDISEDGLVYTFKLRKNVKFHDGTAFNAEAVKYNIDRQTDPNRISGMGYAELTYGQVKSTKIIDEYTVEVTLEEPCSPFILRMAMSIGAPMVSPTALKAGGGDLSTNPTGAGTGPYKFVSWARNQNVTLVRNEEYWGEKAKTKNLIFKVMPEANSRVIALNTGEIDATNDLDIDTKAQIEKFGNKIYDFDGMNVNYLAFNTQSKPFDKVENRRAIAQAIDRNELVKTLYKGSAVLANSFIPSSLNGYDKSIEQVKFDQEASKKALESAGIKSLKIVTYSCQKPYNSVGGNNLAEAVQEYLRKVNVDAKIESYEWSSFKEKVKKREFDICFLGWNADYGDSDNFLNLIEEQDPWMNVSMYKNDEINDLLAKARTMALGKERDAIYTQVEKKLAQEVPWLPISHERPLSAYRPSVKNFAIHPSGNAFLSKVYKEN